jgi:sugar phosphate isomerase/epimerase
VRFIYFTKLLKGLSVAEMAKFFRDAGVEGADLTVRPGYPVTPDNVTTELPKVVKSFESEGLKVPLVSVPVDFIEPDVPAARRIFDACGACGVESIKLGYFHYSGGRFEEALADARKKLAGFAELAQKSGVRAVYHTHSGSNIGSNCEGMRVLLADMDPHYVGAFVDTGHQTVGGAPFRLALAMAAHWFSLLAIKDFSWEKTPTGWKKSVVPAGDGIVEWEDVRKALADRKYNGVVSLHGEYEAVNLADRLAKAKAELEFLKKAFS